ncbi:CtsR family transcriptional regulator [Megasphaera sp. ASD88]|uniref:CtsR family transcriptional regulator n=1 Tax=Megasphaera stantonii TaxID=2144175 RepID=A0A346AXG8_9FIRM|nr:MULTISPECIES: CtsR family transcriptional regulator [Megasphaera]MDN0045942.1 CtsR family transcriptional regulator [Megasphaera hexanoica]AXL20561.1 CtsR family transcriptional regulator [Megasphaera stantonii]MBM6732019.1 CtsR family transcriptional regulator [Megasphaera stantonii]MCU6713407.1 CtsR family transcriptional regulator [Megasphaera butyrica]OUO46061.1 CtsR family transcriptional regulator [Megasphaera sp. An286]
MSILADKIEQFILHKLLEEEEENIVLRRNELADELNCAPSQISYVLSTRFSNDKGFLVESRRGSGGFVRIVRLRPKQQDRTPVLLEERLPAVSITLDDLDGFLFQLIKQHRMTNREAILMHQTFDALYKEIDDEAKRLAVISRILRHLNTH